MQTLKSTYTGLVTLCLLGLLSQAAGALPNNVQRVFWPSDYPFVGWG